MWSIHFSLKSKERLANQVYFLFFFFFFKWENREANQKPVLPKLQKESAEQRTSPLRCVMIVHTSPFLFFLWGPLLRPWSDTTFLCLSDLKRLKPRLVWYAWYWFFFFFLLYYLKLLGWYNMRRNWMQVKYMTLQSPGTSLSGEIKKQPTKKKQTINTVYE